MRCGRDRRLGVVADAADGGGLLDLARTYLEVQARLWPELAGTAAVPAARRAIPARRDAEGLDRPRGRLPAIQ